MRCFLLSFCVVALLFNGVAAGGVGRNLAQKFSNKVSKAGKVTLVSACSFLACAGLLLAHPQHSGESQADNAVADDVLHKETQPSKSLKLGDILYLAKDGRIVYFDEKGNLIDSLNNGDVLHMKDGKIVFLDVGSKSIKDGKIMFLDGGGKPNVSLNGGVLHKNEIDLATHEGLIAVDRGSLFTLKVPVGFEWEDEGDGKHFIPRYRDVQLAILDGNGKPIENALMMWHRGEVQAKMQFMWGKGDWDALQDKVKGVAVFENLFIPQPLPAEAQLRVTGAKLSSENTPDNSTDEGYFFDIATIQGNDLDLSAEALGALEIYPLIYNWRLKYQQELEIGSTIDWYVQVGDSVSKIVKNKVGDGAVWGPDNPDAPTDTVIYLSAPYGEGEINKALDDYPASYFLVTKITIPVSGSENTEQVSVRRKTVVAVYKQER